MTATLKFAVVAATRVINAAFCLMTALYCLLTYSPFAYQQFIRPHLIQGLVPFVVWHHLLYWIILAAIALSMIRELRAGEGRILGWSYLAVSAAIGVALLISPLLPQVENDGRGLALAFAALGPPIWLAAYDHRRTQGLRPSVPASESAIIRGALLAALIVWAGQTAAMPFRLHYAGEITLTTNGILLGAATSVVVHFLVFVVFALLLVAVLRAAPSREYRALTALAAIACTLVVKRIVFGAISFDGLAAWALAAVVGSLLALIWSSVARRLVASGAGRTGEGLSAVDIWRAPLPGARSRPLAAVLLVGLTWMSYLVLTTVMLLDWNFVLQKLCVLTMWMAAFGYACGVLADRPGRLAMPALVAPPLVACVLFGAAAFAQPRWPRWIGDSTLVPEFVLQGYVAVDPSYRMIGDLLHVPSRADAEFFALIRTHANIATDVRPVEIDLASDLQTTSGRPQPNIFLIVIDSLRRDYLQPYNPAATFTPAIAQFARDGVMFERAFTRYGGTGLSMPSLWTGGMVLHKQYITPYHPMSTLAKLLESERYTKVLSPDHITVQMIAPEASYIELDRGRAEMQYHACDTLREMTGVVGRRDLPQPLFVHTRSLDLHIAHVRRFPVPPGRSYPGFLDPVAAAVEQIDGCFGEFVGQLKRLGLYDNSIIILTADHGDSLGERLTWGHALTLYPEVLRIPLIVRLPPALQKEYRADSGAVSFLTDIAPTLYELTGHQPDDLGPLFGRPLFTRHDAPRRHPTRDMLLMGSSYGAVYGVLYARGRKLYIADGINEREFAYELDDFTAARVGITPEDRDRHRSFIRQQVEELARLYHYQPPS